MQKHLISHIAFTVCISASLIAQHAYAQSVYRWVDKNGKVQYSDIPPPTSEAKEVTTKQYRAGTSQSAELPYAVREAMKRYPVTLYGTDCGEPCTMAQALLHKRGIPFSSRNPSDDPKAATALMALAGNLSVPFLLVGTTQFSGFEENQWNSLLDVAGYPRTPPPGRTSQNTAPKSAPIAGSGKAAPGPNKDAASEPTANAPSVNNTQPASNP